MSMHLNRKLTVKSQKKQKASSVLCVLLKTKRKQEVKAALEIERLNSSNISLRQRRTINSVEVHTLTATWGSLKPQNPKTPSDMVYK